VELPLARFADAPEGKAREFSRPFAAEKG